MPLKRVSLLFIFFSLSSERKSWATLDIKVLLLPEKQKPKHFNLSEYERNIFAN